MHLRFVTGQLRDVPEENIWRKISLDVGLLDRVNLCTEQMVDEKWAAKESLETYMCVRADIFVEGKGGSYSRRASSTREAAPLSRNTWWPHAAVSNEDG
jgi:hypothetical protein